MVHQQNEVPSDLTVYDLISFGRLPYKKVLKTNNLEDEKIVTWAMEITGISEYKECKVMELSGGERQRVFIAMALAQNTDIIFLDEPTTYLDIYHQIQILKIIKKLNSEKGITIVMVLHDINQALQYSHNIIVMKKGKKVISGEGKQVLNANIIHKVYGVKGLMTREKSMGDNYFLPIDIE